VDILGRLRLAFRRFLNRFRRDTLLNNVKIIATGMAAAKASARGMYGIQSITQGHLYEYKRCRCVAGEFYYVHSDT
jgi:hypothetical protein